MNTISRKVLEQTGQGLGIDDAMKKRAVAYCRASANGQIDEGTSAKAQAEEIAQYCRSHNIELKQVFDISGGAYINIFERDKGSEIYELVVNRRVDYIIATHMDRLFRLEKHMLITQSLLASYGVHILTTGEDPQLDRRGESVYSQFAQELRCRQSGMVKKAKMHKARQGEAPGGSRPFGYVIDRTTKHYIKHEEEAKIVKRIYEMALSGMSLSSIAAYLNANEKCKKKWHVSTVKYILCNRVYRGSIVYNTKASRGTQQFILNPESEWIITENAHEPIIGADDFLSVQAMLRANEETIS